MKGLRRASFRPGGPGTSSRATTGAGRRERECLCLGTERARSEAAQAPRTPQNGSAWVTQAPPYPHRRRVPSARASGGPGTVVVEAVELNLGNHRGQALSGMAGSRVQQRLGASPSSHRARSPYFPALSSLPPPTVTLRVTARSPRVVPAGQGPGWGCSTPFSEWGEGTTATARIEHHPAPGASICPGQVPSLPPDDSLIPKFRHLTGILKLVAALSVVTL